MAESSRVRRQAPLFPSPPVRPNGGPQRGRPPPGALCRLLLFLLARPCPGAPRCSLAPRSRPAPPLPYLPPSCPSRPPTLPITSLPLILHSRRTSSRRKATQCSLRATWTAPSTCTRKESTSIPQTASSSGAAMSETLTTHVI